MAALVMRCAAAMALCLCLAACASMPPLTATEKAAIREAVIVAGAKLAIAVASAASTRF